MTRKGITLTAIQQRKANRLASEKAAADAAQASENLRNNMRVDLTSTAPQATAVAGASADMASQLAEGAQSTAERRKAGGLSSQLGINV